jgi:hypothetical protein
MPRKMQNTSKLSKAATPRAPNLSDELILAIVRILDSWVEKLTWEALAEQIEKQLGVRYTRQALDRHARIKLAYQATKERLSAVPSSNKPLTKIQIQKRLADYYKLLAEVARLEKENEALLNQFVRWTYNASIRGLTVNELNAPMPRAERRQTQL